MPNPDGICTCIRKGPIFSLSTRVRNGGLFLSTPQNKIGTEEDAVTRGGATTIRIAGPINIKICNQVERLFPTLDVQTTTNGAFEVAKDPLNNLQM